MNPYQATYSNTTNVHTGTRTRVTRVHTTSVTRGVTASKMRRMGAFAIDVLVYGALTSMLTFIFNFIGTTLASLLYASAHDCTLGAGKSLGRAAVGHRLMYRDGRPVSYPIAIARNALRWLLWSTVILFFVDLALFFYGEGRLLSDHILGTKVCEDPAEAGYTVKEVVVGHETLEDTAHVEAIDPDLRAAQQEIDFDNPNYNRSALDDFDKKLTGENAAVVVEKEYVVR